MHTSRSIWQRGYFLIILAFFYESYLNQAKNLMKKPLLIKLPNLTRKNAQKKRLLCISECFIAIPQSHRSRHVFLKMGLGQPNQKPNKLINFWINLLEDLEVKDKILFDVIVAWSQPLPKWFLKHAWFLRTNRENLWILNLATTCTISAIQ